MNLKESQQSKDQYQLRRIPEIHTQLSVFNASNERFLTDYHFKKFSCSILELDGFHLDTSSKPFLSQLLHLIRSSKSLVKLSLRDTNLNAITIPFRQTGERIETLLESIDLSENSFEAQQQLLCIFSHINVSNLKTFVLSKCNLFNRDFEDLLGVLHLCVRLRSLDLSHTKGVSPEILWGIITNLLQLETLNLRNCQIQPSTLSTVNALLYEHLKSVKEPSFFAPVPAATLLSMLTSLDLSENTGLNTTLVDFLIYAILASNSHLSTITLSDMNLTNDQINQLLQATQDRRITGVSMLDLSHNPLEEIPSLTLATLLVTLVRENRRTLTRVSLDNCNLIAEQLLKIESDFIVKHKMSTYIEEIDVSGNPSIQIDTFMRFFSSAIKSNLRILNWSHSNLSAVNDTNVFASVIKAMPFLESLDISHNLNLSEKSIQAIVSSLAECAYLRSFTATHMDWSSSQFSSFVDALMGRINTASSKDTIDNEIADEMAFKALETIDLSGNQLDADVYQWLRFFNVIFAPGAFKKLANLILRDVHFNDEVAKRFSQAIQAAERVAVIKQSLKCIDVSNTKPCLDYSQIMSDDGFSVFVKTLEKMKSLRRVLLRRTGMNSSKIACLCELVFANQLEMIDISGSENASFADESDYAVNSISSESLGNLFGCVDGSFSQERLTELLRVKAMRDDPKRVFDITDEAEEFKRNENSRFIEDRIIELNLSDNADLSIRSFKSVLQAVNTLGVTKVRSIMLDNCALDVAKTATLVKFFDQAVVGLVKLSLSHNSFDKNNSENAKALLHVVQRKYAATIEELNISYTSFDEHNLVVLSGTIADHFQNLKVFDCSGLKEISPKSLETILTGLTLAAQNSLHTLIMKDMQITLPKQDLLIEMFTYNMFTKITRIDLSNNGFLASNFETFIRSLSVSCGPGLRELNLCSCNLKGDSIRHLSKRFYGAGFTALECLDISGNLAVSASNEPLIDPSDLSELITKISSINRVCFKTLRLKYMNLKDKYLMSMRKVLETVSFDCLYCIDISGNETTITSDSSNAAQNTEILSEYSLLPFFEMIHFKFGRSYKSLNFADMNIEANPRLLSSIDHIVLKFRGIEAFIMPYAVERLRVEQTTYGSSEFRSMHLARQQMFMELIETISRSVVFLDLAGQQLSDTALFSIKDMSNLEYLDLSYNLLMTAKTISNLSNCPRISTLKVISITSDELMVNSLIAYVRNAPLHVRVAVNYQIITFPLLRRSLLETVLQQPVYKSETMKLGYRGIQSTSLARYNENYLLKLAEDDDDTHVHVRFCELPKVDVGPTNQVLYRVLESRKAWIRLDLAMASRNRGQLDSLHYVLPQDNLDFSDLAAKIRSSIKSGCLFISVAYVQKFLKVFPVQSAPEDQIRFFLSEQFLSVCAQAGVKQIVVDHPNYMIQPESYSKNDINLIIAAAKKYGIQKIYLDYHLEIEGDETQQWIVDVLNVVPPSGIHFHPITLPISFIAQMHATLQAHPYFKYCDMNAIEIEGVIEKQAIIYREQCYQMDQNRLSGISELKRRVLFRFYDWIARELYMEALDNKETAVVPTGILFAWFFIMAFCVAVQQLILDPFYATMVIIFSFLVANYAVEFYLHYMCMRASRECFQYVDEITLPYMLLNHSAKYLISAVISWKHFCDFFLVRLCWEQDLMIFGYIVLGYIGLLQLIQVGIAAARKHRQPSIVVFEILAILFEQLHAQTVALDTGLGKRAFAVKIKIFGEIIPSIILYLIFFGLADYFRLMALWGLLFQFVVLAYLLVLLLAIAPTQTTQIEFDLLSDNKSRSIEGQRNKFLEMYNEESLRSLDSVICKRIPPAAITAAAATKA